MPTTIKNEDGTETEVFTAEELEEQKQAAVENFKAENPDKSDELIELQEKLNEANEKLTKVGDKDYNFKALEKAKKEAEQKLEDFSKQFEEKASEIKKEVLESVNKDHYNENIKALSGGDAELEKKIDYH